MSKIANEPAFPEIKTDRECDPPDTYSIGGLTKREYFAGLAMQGILAHDYDSPATKVAENAIECVDALLAELERTK